MKAHIWNDVTTQTVKVALLLGERHGIKLWASPFGTRPDAIEANPGSEIPVFLTLNQEIADAIGIKPDDFVEQRDATNWHLEDALTIRDRLLTLVERTHGN